jgi:hypothetical protein
MPRSNAPPSLAARQAALDEFFRQVVTAALAASPLPDKEAPCADAAACTLAGMSSGALTEAPDDERHHPTE